jgi:RimJ/RimL family protein N-acetyltransferase
MTELRPEQFASVLSLYQQSGRCFPLISAVLQQKQRGQVFVDRQARPRSALVITNFGFALFLGDPDNDDFNGSIEGILSQSDIIRPSYLLWYDPPSAWSEKFSCFEPEIVKRRERIRFQYPEGLDGAGKEPDCPVGFEIRQLDRALMNKTEKFNLQIGSRFWSSEEDFCANGIGTCIMKDGDIASLCYAACVVDGLAEVDIVTDPVYRGTGLATVVAEQFIGDCLRKKVYPTWDCFSYNEGSMRLAEKLGFMREFGYTLFSFNIPVAVTMIKPGAC